MSKDTADVVGSDLDVSLVTPGWSPGVLDEEVVLSRLGSVSDSEDSVIELGSAGGASDDTGGVGLEDSLVSLDGNGDWSLGESGLKVGTSGVSSDINVVADLSDTLGGVVLASECLSSGVWVVRLELKRSLLDVLESVVHKTTIAAHVSVLSRAVNKLLLGERLELASGNELGTLDGSGGGEGPA